MSTEAPAIETILSDDQRFFNPYDQFNNSTQLLGLILCLIHLLGLMRRLENVQNSSNMASIFNRHLKRLGGEKNIERIKILHGLPRGVIRLLRNVYRGGF